MREFPIIAVSIMRELAHRLGRSNGIVMSTDGTTPGVEVEFLNHAKSNEGET